MTLHVVSCAVVVLAVHTSLRTFLLQGLVLETRLWLRFMNKVAEAVHDVNDGYQAFAVADAKAVLVELLLTMAVVRLMMILLLLLLLLLLLRLLLLLIMVMTTPDDDGC